MVRRPNPLGGAVGHRLAHTPCVQMVRVSSHASYVCACGERERHRHRIEDGDKRQSKHS